MKNFNHNYEIKEVLRSKAHDNIWCGHLKVQTKEHMQQELQAINITI